MTQIFSSLLAHTVSRLVLGCAIALLINATCVLAARDHRLGSVAQAQGEIEPDIIGGKNADEGEYPFMIRLHHNDEPDDIGCGGTLIDPLWVLTAAHCVTYPDSETPLPVDILEVTIGRVKLNDVNRGETIKVSQNVVHEDYIPNPLTNDIALLRLAKAPSSIYSPVRLYERTPSVPDLTEPNTHHTTIGWGSPSIFAVSSNALKEIELPIIDGEFCGSNFNAESMVCVDLNLPFIDGVCDGDSGGPLLYNNDSVWFQTGIVSYGTVQGCLDGDAVYTRVDAFIDWIHTQMGPPQVQARVRLYSQDQTDHTTELRLAFIESNASRRGDVCLGLDQIGCVYTVRTQTTSDGWSSVITLDIPPGQYDVYAKDDISISRKLSAVTLAPGQVTQLDFTTVAPYLPGGDYNADDKINLSDFSLFVTYYRVNDPRSDFDENGRRSVEDFLIWRSNYRLQGDYLSDRGDKSYPSLKVQSVTATDGKLYLLPSQGTFGVGDEFDVQVQLDTGGATVDAVDAIVRYDPCTFEVEDIERGSAFDGNYELHSDPERGEIVIGADDGGDKEGFSGDDTIAIVRFKAIQATANSKINVLFQPGKTTESNAADVESSEDIIGTTEDAIFATTGEPSRGLVSYNTNLDFGARYYNDTYYFNNPYPKFSINPEGACADSTVEYASFEARLSDGQQQLWQDSVGSNGWSATFDYTNIPDQELEVYVHTKFNFEADAQQTVFSAILDRTAPEATLQIPTQMPANGQLPVTWSATDNLSGIDYFELQYVAENSENFTSLQFSRDVNVTSLNLDPNLGYYLNIVATDMAGNSSFFTGGYVAPASGHTLFLPAAIALPHNPTNPATVPVQSVSISGPSGGQANVSYLFDASIAPTNATQPISYSWSPDPASGQGTASVSYSWPNAGTQTIQVTVSNAGGNASASKTIGIGGLYFTDAFDAFEVGAARIHKLENGEVSIHYTRPSGMLHSLALAPNGILYFLDANGFTLYKLESDTEEVVHTHTTYVRDIQFDSQGRLYFSEATGGGGDGFIYRLDGSSATVFYQVQLSQVDGYWSGNFAFDNNDNLWLSSGNLVPADLYKVVSGDAHLEYTSPEEPFEGFFFEPSGTLVYANGRDGIYRLKVPEFEREGIYTFPSGRDMSDVAPLAP